MAVSTRTYMLAAVSTLAVGLAAGYAVIWRGGDRLAACSSSLVAGDVGGPFTLVDETGATVTDKQVLAGPSLVYFGYTFCPDVCPLDSARNAEAVDALEEMGYEVTPVFISVDPARDTPEVLREWTDFIHPRMVGLTGSEAQIDAVAKAYRTYYKVPDAPKDDLYLVDHMTHTYLMLPNRGFAAFYGRDQSADSVASNVACFLDATGA